MDPSLRDGGDVARELDVDPATGLGAAEAARRLQRDGPNELQGKPPVPLWRKVLAQFQDPLTYLLLFAVAVSMVAWAAEEAIGVPVDAVVISTVLLANATLGFVQSRRAEKAVAALQSMTAATSSVLRDGALTRVPSQQLVRGDVLVLGEGDAVGADARLLTAAALHVSEASLTGESVPVVKSDATLPGPAPLMERTDMVYRGTAVVQGVGRAVVTATGMDTEMGAIAELLEATPAEPTPLRREITAVSKVLGATVVGIAVAVMVVTAVVNRVSTLGDFATVLLLGVSLAVAAVPEGLPAILTVVLALGVQRMAGRNAVVKELSSVEALGSATVIASDKTGTLTKNEMTIQRVRTASGEVQLTGVGYDPDGTALAADGTALADPSLQHEVELALAGGALANEAQLACRDGVWEIQGDPTEAAFLVAARKLPGVLARADGFERRAVVPFTSERKRMSVQVDRSPGRSLLVVKGAPELLAPRCTRVQVGHGAVPFDPTRRQWAQADVDALSANAFRTLAVAYRWLDGVSGRELCEDDECDLTYVGVVGIIDPPRDEASAAVADAHRAGVRVLMITGDHPGTASRVAETLGICAVGAPVVTGAELDAMSPHELRTATSSASVYARVAPKNKLQIVDALQARGDVVAMTGDGVNDAPALKAANIGVAMGISGTEVTKDAADMILADDNFATIVAAVREGRAIFDNIRKFLRYLLSSNIGEVFTVFFGVVFAGFIGITGAGAGAVAVPLLATQILWINLVTDAAPALAMGVDPEIDDVMARRPRRAGQRIIDRRMWVGILGVGLVMSAATLLTMDVVLPGGLVAGDGTLAEARTAGFTTLVFAQLFNTFNSRSETTSAFRSVFTNRWLWASVALGAGLQAAVVELPVLQAAFGTVELGWRQWGLAITMASSVLWFDELRKLVLRAVKR